MPTVKEVLDEFCDRTNTPRESAYVTGTSPNARQLVSLLKFIGAQLLEHPTPWSQLKRIYTFTTSTGVANYQLPGDFLRMIPGTQWDATNQIPLAGPLSNARLAFQTYGVNIATPFAGYQVNGAQGYIFNTVPYTQRSAGYFQISPPGQNNTTQLAIAYTSSNWAWPTDWVASTAYTAGQRVTGINNIYRCITGGTSGTTRPSVLTGTVVDGTVTWQVDNEPYTLAADTDFILLDEDLFIEGMRWAWYRAKKQDYLQERKDWEMSVRSSANRTNGNSIINAGYDVNAGFDWPVVPQGGWTGTGDV